MWRTVFIKVNRIFDYHTPTVRIKRFSRVRVHIETGKVTRRDIETYPVAHFEQVTCGIETSDNELNKKIVNGSPDSFINQFASLCSYMHHVMIGLSTVENLTGSYEKDKNFLFDWESMILRACMSRKKWFLHMCVKGITYTTLYVFDIDCRNRLADCF